MRFRIDEQITFRKLEVLLAFMETGNLARAAELLGTSAVSVHRALKSLEQGMRCALFRNEGRNLVPLESAHVLADAAREVLQVMQQGVQATRDAGGYGADHIRIGSMYSLTIRLIPRLLIDLKVRKPNLQTELVLGSNAQLMEKLRSGGIDAALLVLPEADTAIERVPLFQDTMLFAAPLDWRPHLTQAVDLRECMDEKFVSLAQGFATEEGFRQAFAAAGYVPQIAMRTGDIFSVMSLVSGGIGCTLLPSRARDAFTDRLRWLALAQPYRVDQMVGLVFLRARERDPTILSLLSVCRTVRFAFHTQAGEAPPQ